MNKFIDPKNPHTVGKSVLNLGNHILIVCFILAILLATEGFDYVDGKILPPTKPGLGIELNKDAIKKYQVA